MRVYKHLAWEDYFSPVAEIDNFTENPIKKQIVNPTHSSVYVYDSCFENMTSGCVYLQTNEYCLFEKTSFLKCSASNKNRYGGCVSIYPNGNNCVFAYICSFNVGSSTKGHFAYVSFKDQNNNTKIDKIVQSSFINTQMPSKGQYLIRQQSANVVADLINTSFNACKSGCFSPSSLVASIKYSCIMNNTGPMAINFENTKSENLVQSCNVIYNTISGNFGAINSGGLKLIIKDSCISENTGNVIYAKNSNNNIIINTTIDANAAIVGTVNYSATPKNSFTNEFRFFETKVCLAEYQILEETPFMTPFMTPFKSPIHTPFSTPMHTTSNSSVITPFMTPMYTTHTTKTSESSLTPEKTVFRTPINSKSTPAKTPHETWNGEWAPEPIIGPIKQNDVPIIRETHMPLQTDYIKTSVPVPVAAANISIGTIIVIVIITLAIINVLATAKKIHFIKKVHGEGDLGKFELEVDEFHYSESFSFYSDDEFDEKSL